MSVLEDYVKDLRGARLSGAATPETSFYPALANLLNAVGQSKALKPRALTTGWGHYGQNNVVMPGRGRVIERDYTPEECEALRQGAEALGMTLDDVLVLLGERAYDIHLNGDTYWRNVPKNVWDYVIGGYQIIKKWLSYREQPILGRPLSLDEAREVTNIARPIAAIVLLQPQLDANYAACKADTYEWGTNTQAERRESHA